MAKQDDTRNSIEKRGWRKASEAVQAFKNRRVYFCEPLSLALQTNRRDPITGMPGLPAGAIIEVASGAGQGKTALAEHVVKNILLENPANEAAFLVYEVFDNQRFQNLEPQGFDLSRIYLQDYSNSTLETAEVGLNLLLDIAQHEESVKVCVIDSLGAMAVSREVFSTDKQGKPTDELKGVDETPQMAIRANIVTRFINQWITIDPNKRPILLLLNHMKDQIDNTSPTTRQMKVNQIGEDLNLITPCGVGFKFHCDMRIKANARKWPSAAKAGDAHKIFEYKEQKGLEIFYSVYRNRYWPGFRKAHCIYDFSDHRNCHFQLEEEILSYASFLELDGIVNSGSGYYKFPPIDPKKSFRENEIISYLKERPDLKKELIIKIAARTEDLFSFKKSKKDEEQL